VEIKNFKIFVDLLKKKSINLRLFHITWVLTCMSKQQSFRGHHPPHSKVSGFTDEDISYGIVHSPTHCMSYWRIVHNSLLSDLFMKITVQLSAVGVTEALVNMYKNTWHDFIRNSNPHKHRCEHLKFHKFCRTYADFSDKVSY